MNWVCLDDRTALTPRDGVLTCPACNNHYDVVEGLPVFTRSERERAGAEDRPALLDELWRSMQREPAVEAATAFCDRHDHVRSPYGPDRRQFLAPPPDGVAVEIGAGFGDGSDVLAGRAGHTISVVPNLINARIVGKHLRERLGADWPVVVMRELSRLPLADSSVQTVALDDASAGAFGLSDTGFPAIAGEWFRVLAPGGVVVLGLAGGLRRLPFLPRRAHGRPVSLNRLVQNPAGGHGRLGAAHTTRTMTGLGFEAPLSYAPFPDENDARVVIPANDDRVVRYLLGHLIRRNSRTVRLAIAAARGLVALGLFRHFLPYRYLLFRKRERT